MTPLRLSPFPTHRADDKSTLLLMEREGFVDEAVVAALVTSRHSGRSVANPDDLALAADDLDFAGWLQSKSVTARSAEVPPQVIDAIVRRTLPPPTEQPLHGSRRSPSRRWWLTGLALLLVFPAVLLFLQAHFGNQLFSRVIPTSIPDPMKIVEPVKGVPEVSQIQR